MPIPRPHPTLMAIGDSLAQGCGSLSVAADCCAQCWPARIAQTKDFEFVAPDLPRPILFDLEIRGSPFKTGPVVNDWRAGSPRRPFFDPSDFRCQAKLRGNRDSLIEAFPLRLG
jgi:hypothetical protein